MSNNQALSEEISSIKTFLKSRTMVTIKKGRKKNAKDSIEYRKKGNDLYKSKDHNEIIHEQIWKIYTQSIALAPNESEELACGYGNRSALLFHMQMFEDCIKDCDKAMNITKSDCLKTKLLTRKAECLILLNEPVAEDVVKEAMQSLEKLQLDSEALKSYDMKLKQISSNCSKLKGTEGNHNSKLRKKYIDELSNFPRSKEVPCASTSVAIRYNQQLGRYIVATKDIRPGEIVAIEKNYYTFLNPEGRYLYCSNCASMTLSSIPCEHCIFDVYCSESCRTEGWKKYHQWECNVIPFLWDLDYDAFESCLHAMKLAFIAINEVGDFDNMRTLLIELDECKDPRTKGFIDGIFNVNSAKSIYSLMQQGIAEDLPVKDEFVVQASVATSLIAKNTTFFGYKMNTSMTEIFQNHDVLFFAALLLRSFYVTNRNARFLGSYRLKPGDNYATLLRSFSGLLNHACDSNIDLLDAQDNTTVAYALKPINKGTQLTISYAEMNFLKQPKQFRQDYLRKNYNFTCQCLACIENWSNICVPSIEMIETVTPRLGMTLNEITGSLPTFQKALESVEGLQLYPFIKYSPELMQETISFLESVAKKFTTHCDAYNLGVDCLFEMFRSVFGSFLSNIPLKCFKN